MSEVIKSKSTSLIENVFYQDNLPCVCILNKNVGRCGYVGVNQNHPLCGVDWTVARDIIDIDVHGGLTFSGAMLHGGNLAQWFFGFDCAHLGDNPPIGAICRLFEDVNVDMLRGMCEFGGRVSEVIDVEYDCARLAERLHELSFGRTRINV